MAFEILDTQELAGITRNLPALPDFWLSRYFRRSHFSDSQWIEFDELTKGRRLAPFVAPNVQGQPMLQAAQAVRRFKPAYIKPKDAVDPARLLKRMVGEALGGTMSLQEREDAIIAEILADHRDMILRRHEWMACEAIRKGQVTISGENYPERTVIFGRKDTHDIVLTGSARWGESGADPLGNIKAWNTLINASGSKGVDLIMGSNVSGVFFDDEKVQRMLETRRGSSVALESFNVDGSPVQYHGSLTAGTNAGLNLFTYSEIYEDNDGTEQPFLDPNEIVLVGDPDGVRAFGAIMDRKAQWAPTALFQKMWEAEDPSGLFLMSQSAPLMVPGRPNATVRATVL